MKISRGFTLVEMVIALTLISIVAAMSAVFFSAPMQSYSLNRERLDITDSMELALRRMEQDLRQALPNSPRGRSFGSDRYIEFLATKGSARFRTTAGGTSTICGAAGNDLNAASDTCFVTLGSITTTSAVATNSDYIVINNQGADAFQNGAANGPNKARITAFTLNGALAGNPSESVFRFTNQSFPVDLFTTLAYVVSGPVSYGCIASTGQLIRYSGYAISAVQNIPPANATRTVIASNIMDCSNFFTNTTNTTQLNQDIQTFSLTFRRSDAGQNEERATLFGQIPVRRLR